MILFEHALFRVQVQVVRSESLEHPVHQFLIVFQVIFVALLRSDPCVDGYVVHVDHHASFIDKVPENHVHHGLEGGGRVGETEEHDRWLVEPFVGDERRFPSIFWFNEHLVIPPLDIDTGEHRAVS